MKIIDFTNSPGRRSAVAEGVDLFAPAYKDGVGKLPWSQIRRGGRGGSVRLWRTETGWVNILIK
jgi:hypothetical protein